uniref:Reverse transcriptase domain-containing protein n=1 Tax=Tanacetum cinerariifolium TaxID=118510 RepID=A0A699I6P2_TANCI|nr:reverse transcriptase domain-containing protein [Tanacetum cinerariifolium]
MRTRSSSNLPVESPPNLSISNPKRRNRRGSKKPFILGKSPVDTMVDQRTMAELLRAARRWLEKEPPRSILTWEDLIIKIINEFFPLSRTTNLFNQQTSAVTTDMTAILKQFQATPPPAFVKSVEEICVTCVGAHPYYQCLVASGKTFPELRDNIQGYVAAAAVNYNQGNFVYRPPAITTRSGIVLDGPSIPILPLLINPKEDERVEETLTDKDLANGYPKEVTQKLGDPGKFIILCGFNELKCKALADLGASINLMRLSVWKKLADFVIVDYKSDPRVPLILGRPFLRTAHALIDVHSEEMILHDGDERLTLNMRHTSSYSKQPQKESINLINVFNDSSENFLEDLFSTNQPSGNPTFSSHPELTSPEVKDDIFDPDGGNVLPEKLLDLDSTKDLYSPLHFDIESDLKEIEYLLHHDPIKDTDSILKDSINQSNLANVNDNLVVSMPEMFTDEHALDYSSPPLFDEYDDDLFKVESDTENVYDDPFDSKVEKIKESKLLIDELDLPCDFLLPSEYDSFLSEDFSKVDDFPSTNNEDKVFNPGILIQGNLFEVITHVAQEKKDKKLAISHASLMIEDFDPSLYELPFFKEVPRYSWNLKTHAKGFCPPVFISSTSLGNHVSKSNRTNVYLLAYLINGLRFM